MHEDNDRTMKVCTLDENPAADHALRLRAEEILQVRSVTGQTAHSAEESQRLVHELQVHQLELEMQNTELRQTRGEVERVLEMYADLYEFAPVGYLTLDLDRTIRDANITGAAFLGIERSRLIGIHFELFVAAEIRPTLIDFLVKVFLSSTKESCELALGAEGDAPRFVQIEAVACKSEHKCRVVLIDITQRRQLEEQLERQQAELLTANIELEAFNYTVSHDLLTPLTALQGYSQILRDLPGDQLRESAKDYLQEIDEAAQRMSRLIASLLTFSKVAHSKICREKVDLGGMAKAIVDKLEKTLPKRRVTFKFADRMTCEGDADLLGIVLGNLIGNAWKYTGQQKETIIELGQLVRDGVATFFVKDNGPGFAMADAEKLFIPFQQLPGEVADGHGIGLATVQRIIQRHGGRVWAESTPGKGATFYFTLQEAERS
jgi:signal transduction histidine kinase